MEGRRCILRCPQSEGSSLCLRLEVLPCSAGRKLRAHTHTHTTQFALPCPCRPAPGSLDSGTGRRRGGGSSSRHPPQVRALPPWSCHGGCSCVLSTGLGPAGHKYITTNAPTIPCALTAPAGQQLEATRRHPPPPASLAATPMQALLLQVVRLSRAANRSLQE